MAQELGRQLELGGRKVVIKLAMSKNGLQQKKAEDKSKDKRNIGMYKEGLLNRKDFKC